MIFILKLDNDILTYDYYITLFR